MFTPKTKPHFAMRVSAIWMAATITLMGAPMEAQAGLKEALNEMFINTSTSAQSIETQRLRGIYGGSMTLRPIGRGIDIVQFAPPRIDAGCGGIDIFFGSFSFINGAQFEQLIRAIAANAVGFAIKAAIQGMCSPCANIINKLEDAIRQLNAMAKNTCATAKALMTEGGRDKLLESARNIGTSLKNAFSLSSDTLAAENESQSEKATETASGNGNAKVAENNPKHGNLVYRAAKDSMSGGANTLRAFLSEEQVIQIVMGLYGTVIVTPQSSGGKTCPADAAPESCVEPPKKLYPTITHWDRLFYPKEHSEKGVDVWACNNQACTDTRTSVIPLAAWGGVEEFVNMALFGVAVPGDAISYSPNSIVGSFVLKVPLTRNSMNAQARQLERILPFPLIRGLMELQQIPGAPEMLGLQVAKMLPKYFAYQLATEFMSIGQNTFTEQTSTEMPKEFSEALQDKARQLTHMRPGSFELIDMFTKTVQSIKVMQELTNSQMRAGVGGSQP